MNTNETSTAPYIKPFKIEEKNPFMRYAKSTTTMDKAADELTGFDIHLAANKLHEERVDHVNEQANVSVLYTFTGIYVISMDTNVMILAGSAIVITGLYKALKTFVNFSDLKQKRLDHVAELKRLARIPVL